MNKKTIKKIALALGVIVLLGGGYAASQYFMPHRDIQAVEAFVEFDATQLVDEYLADQNAANKKYLDQEGESKVIIVKGEIKNIDIDQKNQKVITLKSNNAELGIRCTFIAGSEKSTKQLTAGNIVRIKGEIISGAEFDEDLELYEDATMGDCAIVK